MPSYDIAQYLLDRANIHDTVTRVPLYYDTGDITGLLNHVYGETIEIDYSSITGGSPFTTSRADWTARVGGLLDVYTSTQHVTSGIIAHLPQPGADVVRPEKVAVQAQVSGNMVGKAQDGGSAGVPFTQNGGLLEAELQWDAALEAQGQNPWRITKYKVVKKWDRREQVGSGSSSDK
ncbi:uncharacterized protein B0H64DRAFT_25241 [Chaetomium fimeti]|uniref:SnoaL-like domain-containing protein n=1 Tax=Chaetomium fimeti TaxID=1854472 RepID=A0AAE0LX60_9PEZI|nr:hypothetical protein B0H64DRAFT_25241 [Chaetomium fimeti]